MTDNDIIKCLICCKNADCVNCPRWSESWYSGMCNDFLDDVLRLIYDLRSKIKALQMDNEQLQCDIINLTQNMKR